MMGAIWTVAVGAILSSAIATIGNHAIARDFPDFKLDENTDLLVDPALAIRYAQYRLTANIFYWQSLVLWTVLGLLVACEAGLRLLA
ncbi:MAG: hypothetical protein ACOY4R_05625 [Pseudomonadota bacterium]